MERKVTSEIFFRASLLSGARPRVASTPNLANAANAVHDKMPAHQLPIDEVLDHLENVRHFLVCLDRLTIIDSLYEELNDFFNVGYFVRGGGIERRPDCCLHCRPIRDLPSRARHGNERDMNISGRVDL